AGPHGLPGRLAGAVAARGCRVHRGGHEPLHHHAVRGGGRGGRGRGTRTARARDGRGGPVVAREFGTVGVVGLGTMGAGIAEVLARGGLDVIASEVDAEALERGRATLTRSVDRAVNRGRLSAQDREALLSRIRFTVGL